MSGARGNGGGDDRGGIGMRAGPSRAKEFLGAGAEDEDEDEEEVATGADESTMKQRLL